MNDTESLAVKLNAVLDDVRSANRTIVEEWFAELCQTHLFTDPSNDVKVTVVEGRRGLWSTKRALVSVNGVSFSLCRIPLWGTEREALSAVRSDVLLPYLSHYRIVLKRKCGTAVRRFRTR